MLLYVPQSRRSSKQAVKFDPVSCVGLQQQLIPLGMKCPASIHLSNFVFKTKPSDTAPNNCPLIDQA